MHIQLLAADQHSDVGSLFARYRQLVLDLKRHVLGNAIAPEPRAELARRLAFENLDARRTDDFAVEIGEHERNGGMPEYGVDAPHAVSSLLRVRRGDNGLKQRAPVDRLGRIMGTGRWQVRIATGLDQPQFQHRLVRIQAHGGSSVRAADPGFPHLKPVCAWHVFRFHEP